MTAITAKQIRQLDKMNAASKRAGGLGTLLMGGASIPASGTLSLVNTLKYTSAPALATTSYVHASIALTASTQTIITAITNPDVPRIITITGNASGNAGNVVITGTNIADAVITDTIALSGTSTVLGVKAFKTVTSIALPAETHAGTDSILIGTGSKIGFPSIIDNTGNVLSKDFNGAVDAGTVTAATTVEGSIYAPAGTLDGAKLLELTYIVVG